MKKQIIHAGKFLNYSKIGRWEFAERTHGNGECVGVLAVTEEKEIILVEQFRIPVGKPTIELTAGLVGDELEFAEESVAETANRELIEETGYSAKKMTYLMLSPSSAGLSNETVHLFVATDLKKVSEGGGLENEELIIHKVPMQEIVHWCEAQVDQGKIVDAKIFTCLFLAKEKGIL